MDELIEEVVLRLPPDDPACLVRASAACKPWRRILAAPRFRRRYREFHGTPPVLGFFHKDGNSFVPTSSFPRALPDHPHWRALDCRHGRALFATYASTQYYEESLDFAVLDPLTGHQRRVPFPMDDELWFSAAVLCATQGCDHHDCEEGHFLVVFICADEFEISTSAQVYSSETGTWSDLISVPEPNVMYYDCNIPVPSVFVGDAVYFNSQAIVKYQLGTCRLSTFKKPTSCDGTLVTAEDGGLRFAAVVDGSNLSTWSRETEPEGAAGWVKLRVIDLKKLLPDGAVFIPTIEYAISQLLCTIVSGAAEGTQVIFVKTGVGCYSLRSVLLVAVCTTPLYLISSISTTGKTEQREYMVDLKSARSKKVSDIDGENIFPYVRFYIPAMEAASTGQLQ